MNGNRSQTAYLKNGDVLTLGPVTLIFQLPDSDSTWLDEEETVLAGHSLYPPPGAMGSSDNRYAILASVTGFIALVVAGVYMFV